MSKLDYQFDYLTRDEQWDNKKKAPVNNISNINAVHRRPLKELKFRAALHEAVRRGEPFFYKGASGNLDIRWESDIYIVSFKPTRVEFGNADDYGPVDFLVGMKKKRPFMMRPPLIADPRKEMVVYIPEEWKADLDFKFQHLYNRIMMNAITELTGRGCWQDRTAVDHEINHYTGRLNNVYAGAPFITKLSFVKNGMEIDSGFYEWMYAYIEHTNEPGTIYTEHGSWQKQNYFKMDKFAWYFPDGDLVPNSVNL